MHAYVLLNIVKEFTYAKSLMVAIYFNLVIFKILTESVPKKIASNITVLIVLHRNVHI